MGSKLSSMFVSFSFRLFIGSGTKLFFWLHDGSRTLACLLYETEALDPFHHPFHQANHAVDCEKKSLKKIRFVLCG